MEREYIYIGIVFSLLGICLLFLRFKSRKKRRTTVNSTHEREVCHEPREYTIYTIPQNRTTLSSQPNQHQPEEPQRKYDDDLPPKYDDLVLQKSTNAENAVNYPPRYNF